MKEDMSVLIITTTTTVIIIGAMTVMTIIGKAF